MAIQFSNIIAGEPPAGGDTGAEFALKINEGFESVKDELMLNTEGFINRETIFHANEAIEEVLDNGFSRMTVMESNGAIRESLYKESVLVESKMTIFNADGSISEVMI